MKGWKDEEWEAVGYFDNEVDDIPRLLTVALRRKRKPDAIRPMIRLGDQGLLNVTTLSTFRRMVAQGFAFAFEPRDWGTDTVLYLAAGYQIPEVIALKEAERRMSEFVEGARSLGYERLSHKDVFGARDAFDRARRVSNEIDDYVRVCILEEPFQKGFLRAWLKSRAPNLVLKERARELGITPESSRDS